MRKPPGIRFRRYGVSGVRLPPPCGLRRRSLPAAPRLRNVKVLNYLPLEPLALLSDPDCGEAFDVCSIFY